MDLNPCFFIGSYSIFPKVINSCIDQNVLPLVCGNMDKRIWVNLTILLTYSCLVLNHMVLVTCCFPDLSYPFQAGPSFLQTPVSPHNPAVKAASPLPGLLFSGLLEIPHHFIVNRACKPEKPFGMNPCWAPAISWAATAWHNLLPYAAGSQASLGQGKKSLENPSHSLKMIKTAASIIKLELGCLVRWNCYFQGWGPKACVYRSAFVHRHQPQVGFPLDPGWRTTLFWRETMLVGFVVVLLLLPGRKGFCPQTPAILRWLY